MSNFRKAIRAARNFLKHYSPAWLNVEINKDFFENFTTAIASQPEILPPINHSPSRSKPHWRRITKVYQILDLAHESGIVSYTALIDCVREATGKGCSRKLISKWKLERGLR